MKKVKNTFYLIGPLALVSFFLFDFIGGMNYPGFDWPNQSPLDIVAWDSYDLVLGFVFLIIAALLAIVAGYLVFKFFKNWKPNKLLVNGVLCVFLAVIVSGLGFNIFHAPNAGTIEYVTELHVQNLAERASITENENKIFEEKMANGDDASNQNTISTDASSSNSTADSTSANTSVSSADATSASTSSDTATSATGTTTTSSAQAAIETSNQKIQDNLNIIIEKISDPMMIGIIVVTCLSVLLSLVGCFLMAIGGLRKGRIKTIGIVSIVLGALTIIGLLYTFFGQQYIGYSGRVLLYIPYVLVAFLSAWIYAYEPAEK